MMILHDNLGSGNGYKVRLLLSHLGQPFKRIEYDVTKGETRTAEFLALNPDGRIPLLQFTDGRVLTQSNAILFFLAQKTSYLPSDSFAQAQALQWMFFEQYSHEPNIAVARYWLYFLDRAEVQQTQLEEKWQKGYQALDVMEQRLGAADYLVDGGYSIADIALYAYTHVADEADMDLGPYPGIRRWLDRVAEQPGHVLITQDGFS
ncbi:MAG: glutathione S-transferase family protein [Rhodospirillaceae bacterium]|jgi:glutathione S-transferase|nr:glutathione S-transferase family protein [Rhodospirillaceae bacterium]MBT4045616.1 glutathione S-transferase family protein [Rhodospirillaceae bacterium]MBT4691565.1 glutathione S-transferase family protein [Rhodospirillaceae bacterium]MBT5083056.1 glutathione S-transferase family protein [Rhodospirillaceae bacterium]MBT5524500.1 glutathione S-transferase family protein [Rhodospirillaceae bacterium]